MLVVCVVSVSTLLGLVVIRKFLESRWGNCNNNVMLDGKVAIVTGANSGIGLEVAKQLALRNAEVILACRTLEKAKQTCEFIKLLLPNEPKVVPMELNLASLKSVQMFSYEVHKKYSSVNLLINNAGVAYTNDMYINTEDNFEIQYGVNYLGHYYLTKLLLDTLLKDSSSRVVVVTSLLHEKGDIDVDDLNNIQKKKKINMYANSKLACAYFARELARRQKSIKVYACCPGWVYTGLFRHSKKWYHYLFFLPIAFFFMRTPYQGSQTVVYCATDPDITNESGLIYRNCKRYESRSIFYESIQIQLWEKSEAMIQEALKKEKA